MRVKRKHIQNLRSIVPMKTPDGYVLRENRIFRSGKLNKVKQKCLSEFCQKYNIDTIIDLRSPSELKDCPDVRADGPDYFHFPPLTDAQNPSVNAKTGGKILKGIMKKEGGAIRHLSETYEIMISSEESRKAFFNSFRVLLGSEDGSVLFHCTQGKDRTGVFAMILLMALGFDRDSIFRDYMFSNRCCRIKNFLIFVEMTIGTLNVKKAVTLHRLLTARKEYFDAVFREIDRLFGDVDHFLSEGIRLTQEDLTCLRGKFLCQESVSPVSL